MISGPLLRANARQTLTRFRGLLVALALGIGVLMASSAVIGHAVVQAATDLDSSSKLTTLELLSMAPSGTPKQLTRNSVAQIKSMAGVEDAAVGGSVGTILTYVSGGASGVESATAEALGGVFWAMPRFAPAQPSVTASDFEVSDALPAGQVLLPNSYRGNDLAGLVGARLTMEYTVAVAAGEGKAANLQVAVVGVFDNSSPLRQGDSAIYLSSSDFEKVLAASVGSPNGRLPGNYVFQSCWVKAQSVAAANTLAEELTAAGYFINKGGSDVALPGVLQLLQKANVLLWIGLGLFGLAIGVTIAGVWANSRRWDVGLLDSFGWSPRQVLWQYTAEIALVGGLVAAGAIGVGVLLSLLSSAVIGGQVFLGVALPAGVSLPPVLLMLAVLGGVPLSLMGGSCIRVLRLVRLEPDDALRRPD